MEKLYLAASDSFKLLESEKQPEWKETLIQHSVIDCTIDWNAISKIPDLPEEFINAYAKHLNFRELFIHYNNIEFILENYYKHHFADFLYYRKLPESLIRKYFINTGVDSWDKISGIQDLSFEFITEFCDKINWSSLTRNKNLSFEVIEKYHSRFSNDCWMNISSAHTLTNEFIRDNIHKFSLHVLISKQVLSKENIDIIVSIIEDPSDSYNKYLWADLVQHQKLSMDFIEKYADKIDSFPDIIMYQNVSKSFIEKNRNKISTAEMYCLIKRQNMISEDFVMKHFFKSFIKAIESNALDYYFALFIDYIKYNTLSNPEYILDKCLSSNCNLSANTTHMFLKNMFWHQELSENARLTILNVYPKLDLTEHISWRYYSKEDKLKHLKQINKCDSIFEIVNNEYIVAYKFVDLKMHSFYDSRITYIVGETYSAKCDYCIDIENSYGLSAWYGSDIGPNGYDKDSIMLKVHINIDDIGAITNKERKIRATKMTIDSIFKVF